ncbi:MAG: NAD(P)-dependent oxidoreductase [Myxococcales bacterium]|nr:NAD(P)-dependent oxidoreductase [Myxococcales bacterium]
MSRVLIAGCGYVGRALAKTLCASGDDVWGLSRTPTGLSEGVVPLAADLRDPSSLSALPADLQTVVFAAAPGGFTEDTYRATYLDGLKNLLDALSDQHSSLRRFVMISTTSVYGQDDGDWVDEASPTEPQSFAGQTVLAAENHLRSRGLPHTVVRLGGIYGPGRDRLLRMVRSKTAICYDGPARHINRNHRDDCAGILHHVIKMEEPADLYLGVDSEPADEREVFRWLAQQLGLPEPEQRSSEERPPRRRPGNKRCRNTRILQAGYSFQHPTYREGFSALLQDSESN